MNQNTKPTQVIVTGAAGYIGGHIALLLSDLGYRVIGVDIRPCPNNLITVYNEFIHADFDSDIVYKKILECSPKSIMHCAGTSLVGPSTMHPSGYYYNNVVKTLNLIEFIRINSIQTKLIFSSSAAVYGSPVNIPCSESDTCLPISPYGESKHITEQMLSSYRVAYGLDYVAFRYFNACGADSNSRHGQENGATHIIARLMESILSNSVFELYGTEHSTEDGTCIRDYVHVEDIARAHVIAMNTDYIVGTYNLGSGRGLSNYEIISLINKHTQRDVVLQVKESRAGDPSILTACSDKFDRIAGKWKLYDIDDIIIHAWKWYSSRGISNAITTNG